MFEIGEISEKNAGMLEHGVDVFHKALAGGMERYHVNRQGTEGYDLVYVKNFDYIKGRVPEDYRFIEGYWDFKTYYEIDSRHIVLDQFDHCKKVVFLETNEYTVSIGRVLLREKPELDLYYKDKRIRWFISESVHLHAGDELPENRMMGGRSS